MIDRIESARRPLDEREERARSLEDVIAAVPGQSLCDSLDAVAEELPLVLPVDFANIRVLGDDCRLYLLSATGCLRTEVRRRAFQPLDLDEVKAMLASGLHDRVAASLGVRYVEVRWLEGRGELVGSVAVGSRTRRVPAEDDRALLTRACEGLGARLALVDRRTATLRACALALARRNTPEALPLAGELAELRPRERTVLELYADGLSTTEIARLAAISPHTVRTHVKLALRRLGARSRDEAATLVRGYQVGLLV